MSVFYDSFDMLFLTCNVSLLLGIWLVNGRRHDNTKKHAEMY